MRFGRYRPGPMDDLEGTPDVGPTTRWLCGVVVAAIPVAYGVSRIVAGEATFHSRTGTLHLTGTAAVMLGLVLISVGLFLHFHFFWAPHRVLWRFAELGKILSLLLFLGSLGTMAYFAVTTR